MRIAVPDGHTLDPGDEVVQMYLRDKVRSATRPVKELKGFQLGIMIYRKSPCG